MPAQALVLPGILGLAVSLSGEGDLILAMAVVGATVSYALMSLSHILLRYKQPNLARPYKTPGGVVTPSIALFLSLVAMTGVYAFSPPAFFMTLAYIIGIAYYLLYSRHTRCFNREEEFEMPH